ncbi:MFS transporter [Aquisalibacillus elongatus]|uniref:Putative MFS family arabinose efflux permease n=1 Tax=Aquisalibacillus elongatus TaxID=485577 RepID=A0A3N5BAK6_9BACI|nr:MFS transporter [Aquisalibacillus elongatus]RPF53989.1 putative MFS family arabinose efflux permease [Aquisalibacillus elongatus]
MDQQSLAKRNLAIMWFANFFVAGSMTMVMPFLSLYIETFGNFSDDYVQTWAGYTFGITFLTAFAVSPIWGRIGDRYGRKPILMIAAFGLATSVFLMGEVQTVFQLFLLRFIMGVFTGFIPLSQALISTQTQKGISGRVLGTLQTGTVTGTLMGPLLGGVLADSFGYAQAFQMTSVTIFIAGLLVAFGLKEFRVKDDENEQESYTRKEVLTFIIGHPMLISVIILSMFVQVAHFAVQPILALYVSELNGPANLAFISGIAFSITGLGNLLMTRRWGRIADRVGYEKILIGLLIAAGLVYLPGAFVNEVWQLVIVRFLLGVTLGGIIPVRMAYIRQVAPINMQGEVMGYNTSLRFLGNVLGPVLGGIVAGWYNISSVFIMTSVMLFSCGMILLFIKWRESHSDSHVPSKTKHSTS